MKTKQNSSVWTPDLGNGYFKNPIIHADYSDPDVIRVEDDFYMVASSFNMSPCLPILHSKDLVNWTIINHVAEKFPDESYNLPRHGDGVWAPSIRYHDGKFWVFFGAPDEGVYMSNTEDPFGQWSPLHLVKKAKGWIDVCPFWDDDGQAYIVNAFARSRIGFKHILQVCKMKPDGTALLDEGKYIFDGTQDHPTIEGPKMYKRNGYYYIFAPAGGVATGWQTILRSKSIYGPYEDKIVLAQGDTSINGPHQGGWVELESGESWFVHFQDKGAYGRITHLQPMSWENDWPVMGTNVDEQGVGKPVIQAQKPNVAGTTNEIKNPQTSDHFEGASLGLQWQWRANVNHSWYALHDNCLRLYAKQLPKQVTTLYDTPQIVTQKFPAETFSATTLVNFKPEQKDDLFGLIIFGLKYSALLLRKSNDQIELVNVLGETDDEKTVEEEEIVGSINSDMIYLRVNVKEDAKCQFSYSIDGKAYKQVGQTFKAKEGKWIGSQVGLFCLNKEKMSSGYTDVQWFDIHS